MQDNHTEDHNEFDEHDDLEFTQNNTILSTKNKQIFLAIAIILVLMLVFNSFIKRRNASDDYLTLRNGNSKIQITGLSNGAKAEDVWLQKSEEKIKQLELLNKQQQEINEKLEARVNYLDVALSNYEDEKFKQEEEQVINQAQQDQIGALYEEIKP